MDDYPESTALDEGEEPVQVFEAPHGYWSSPRGLLIAGLGYILFGVVILFGTEVPDLGRISAIVISGLFSYGLVTLARIPGANWNTRRVLMDDEGLILETTRGQRLLLWTELVHAEVCVSGVPADHVVLLFDRSGRRVAKLTGDLKDFDVLSARVKRKVEEACVGSEELIRLKRDWPNALAMIVGGILISGFSLLFAWGAPEFLLDAWRLQFDGVSGEGIVTEHYTRRDGREYWIAYELLLPPSETIQGRAEVKEDFWRGLAEGAPVAVLYAPDEPRICTLASGEKDPDSLVGWILFFGLFSFGVVMGVVFLSAGALHLARVEVNRRSSGWGFTFGRERLY